MPKLVITDGDGTRELPLDREVKVGRQADNQVQLKVPEASRHHCRFFLEKGSWFVEDLQSSNGTLVNGRKVSKFELQDGDVISIGAASMRFLESEATTAEPTAGGWGEDEISLDTQVFLVLGVPGRTGEVFKLTGEKVVVGRRSKHALCIADASVSNDHAEVLKQGDRWLVRDLGSSNGTFVDGDKVTEHALTSGCTIIFGAIGVTFGIGDPKDFQAPTAVPAEEAAATTEMIPVGSFAESPSFELHDMPARKGGVGGLVALVLIVALGGAAAWLFIQRSATNQAVGDAPAQVHQQTNLIPQRFWSFEATPPTETPDNGDATPGWHKEDALDAATASEVGDPVRSGELALQISRHETGLPTPPTWVSLDGSADLDLSVTAGSGYRLAGAIQTVGAELSAGVVVTWIDRGTNDDVRIVARDVVPGGATGEWGRADGVVVAPDGCNRARVGLVAAANGDATFDDIIFEPTAVPAGRMVEAKGFRAVLKADGSLRMNRFNRIVTPEAGPWRFADKARPVQPWELFSGTTGASAEVKGNLRGGGTLVATMQPAERGLRISWALGGKLDGIALGVPLGSTDIDVTLLDGDRAKRMRTAFAATAATGIIIGGQGDRARLRFVDPAGKPLSLTVSVVNDAGQPVVRVDRGEATTITCEVDLSFDAELISARDLMNQAREAASRGRDGEAVRKYGEVLARFPFEESIEREASTATEHILGEGRKRMKDLSARVDDARFFRTARFDDQLVRDLEAETARFTGTGLEEELKKLTEGFKSERTKSAGEKNEAEAALAYQRAQDYVSDQKGRKEIAAAFLEMVVKRYAGTEWAEPARLQLEKLKSGVAPKNGTTTQPEEKKQ